MNVKKIIEFENPIPLTKDCIGYERFCKYGAVLITDCNRQKAYAQIELDEIIWERLFIERYVENSYKELSKSQVITIYFPADSFKVNLPSRKNIVSRTYFFGDLFSSVKVFYKKVQAKYDVGMDNFYVYFARGETASDVVTYYGCGLDCKPEVILYKEEHLQVVNLLQFYNLKQEYENEKKLHLDKTEIEKKISLWLEMNNFSMFYRRVSEKVIGQPNLIKACVNVYKYLLSVSTGTNSKNNMIIAAPSGSGKTEFFRVLKLILSEIEGFPVIQCDISNVTETGYDGDNVDDVIVQELAETGGNGIGIVFLDEFDKKLIVKSITSSGINTNAAVINQLLVMLEGKIYRNKSNFSTKSKYIDTNKTLFIALGSFDSLRKERIPIIEKTMGFGGSLTSTYQDNYKDISKEELLEADVSYEILGRFVSIINFKRLDSDDVNRIIDLLLKKRSKENGIEVDITEALRKRLLNSANTGYGCRLISNTIDELLLEALIEVYEKPNKYSRIILDMEKRYELEVRTMQIKKSNS